MLRRLSTLLCLTLILSGCGPVGFQPRLVGVWVGQPETAEQRTARGPESLIEGAGGKPRESDAGETAAVASGSGGPSPDRPRSDLESVDVRVTLDLRLDGEAAMWIGDDRSTLLEGSWRLVSTELNRAVIEIVAEKPTGEGDAIEEEKRRYAVQLLEDDRAFTLVEENADKQFGVLYFRKQDP